MANLYMGNGAESNRSDSCLLLATLSTTEDSTSVVVKVDYQINKTSSSGWTKPGDRYGILVHKATVNSSGQLTNAGTVLGTYKLEQLIDGDQSGTAEFTIKKGTSKKSYSGVTFLISDQLDNKRASDSTYQWTGQKGSSVSALPDHFATTDLEIPVGYTKFNKPAAPTVSSTSLKKNEKVTIKWTDPGGGANLSALYELYSSYEDKDGKDGKVVYTGTGTSYNYTIAGEVGGTYTFKVKVLAKNGSESLTDYNSNYSDLSSTVKVINTAPILSVKSITPTILSYEGGEVSATLKGADDNSEQTLEYSYKLNNSSWSSAQTSNKFSIPIPGQEITKKDDTEYTIYFKVSDGIDEATTSKTIIVRAAPQLTLTAEGSGELYTRYYNEAESEYYKSYTVNVDLYQNSSGTLIYYLKHGSNYYELGTTTIDNIKTDSKTFDITNYSTFDITGKTFRFAVEFRETINDNFLHSSGKISCGEGEDYKYTFPTHPDDFAPYNSKGEDNQPVVLINNNYFYDRLYFYYLSVDVNNNENKVFLQYGDTGTEIKIYYKKSSENWENAVSLKEIGKINKDSHIFVDTSTLEAGVVYDFRIDLFRGTGDHKTYDIINKTKIYTTIKSDVDILKFDNNTEEFSTIGNTIYPHGFTYNEDKESFETNNYIKNSGDQTIIFSKSIFGNGTFNAYGLSGLTDIKLKTKRIKEGENSQDEEVYDLGSFTSGNGYYEYILKNFYYNEKVIKEGNDGFYGINNYVGQHTIKFWMEAESSFGFSPFKSNELTLILDFDTPIQISNLNFITNDYNSESQELQEMSEYKENFEKIETVKVLTKDDYVFEKNTITCNFNYQSFSNDYYTYRAALELWEYKDIDAVGQQLFKSDFSENQTFYPTISENETFTLGVPITKNETITFSELPEMSSYQQVVFKIILESYLDNNFVNKECEEISTTFIAAKQIGIDSNFEILEGLYNNNKIQFNYTVSDLGIQIKPQDEVDNYFNTKVKVQYSTDIDFNEENITEITIFSNDYLGFINNTDKQIIIEPIENTWKDSFYYVRLQVITTNKQSLTVKTLNTNALTIYNISPTVSYRQNCLGINYSLDTQNKDFKDAVLIIGESSGKSVIYYVGAGDNLGELQGFLISGGSWD